MARESPLDQFLVAMRMLLRLGAVFALRCLALEDRCHGACSRGGGRGHDSVSMKVAAVLCVDSGLLLCATAGVARSPLPASDVNNARAKVLPSYRPSLRRGCRRRVNLWREVYILLGHRGDPRSHDDLCFLVSTLRGLHRGAG